MKENWQNTTFNRKEYVMSQTQNEQILDYLKSGKSVTPLKALRKWGCFRLSARIFDLRSDGHNIITKNITNDKKTYAEYHLLGKKDA